MEAEDSNLLLLPLNTKLFDTDHADTTEYRNGLG